MECKAAIFDMDGTLIDSLKVWNVLWTKMGEKYLNNKDFRPTPEDDKKVRTLTLADAMDMIHRTYSLGENGAQLLALANSIIADFYQNEVQLKDGVRAFLEHLKSNGVKMCIATATDMALVELAMEHCDLKKYFLRVFSCDTIGKGKDQPDIFLLARDYLGEKPEQTWLFEDSLVAIETATKIGMPTVAIFDQFNYGQDIMKKLATYYIAQGETLQKLIAL